MGRVRTFVSSVTIAISLLGGATTFRGLDFP